MFRTVSSVRQMSQPQYGRLAKLAAVPLRCASDDESGDRNTKQPKRKLPDTTNPNTPLGVLDRIPKADKAKKATDGDVGGDGGQSSVFSPYPDSTNPKTGEVGGPTGPEPTRFGDWERKGRVSDF